MSPLALGVILACFRCFFADRSGSYAILASILSIPLLMTVGLSVDYVNISRVKAEFQQSVDSAALAVAREGDNVTQAQANAIAAKFLQANFSSPHSAPAVTLSGTKVLVSSAAEVPINFGGIFGVPTVTINADAGTEITYANYEIALALDTTGSMAGGKIAAMKEAVNGLIDTMAAQNTRAGALKFALVPFSSMVNVGAQFGPKYDAAGNVTQQPAVWLDSLAKSPIAQNDLDPGVSRFALFKHLNVAWEGCVEDRFANAGKAYDIDDTEASASDAETLFVPAFAGDELDGSNYPNSYLADGPQGMRQGTAVQRMARYGAVYAPSIKTLGLSGQIAASASWSPVSPDFSNQTYFGKYPVAKGPNFGCDVQPIVPLNTDFSSMKSKVNALQALGSTNIVEGAAWGWRVLSSRVPFTEGKPGHSAGVRKILVLLTDGTNNLGQISNTLGSSYTSMGYLADGRLGVSSGAASQITDLMNAKTLQACEGAKADGVEIYTIRLEEPNVVTGNMLRDCATDVDHYFDVPNRALLDDAFAKIKDRIALIRLAS